MKKRIFRLFISVVLLLLLCFSINAQHNVRNRNDDLDARMKWWNEARFGMFIHWGVYSIFGGEWNGVDYGKEMGGASAEWIYLRGNIPKKKYMDAAYKFNPINYNPEKWVKAAKDAGMKYMVLTSKHHDGFALFNTKASDWNIMKSSVYGKDIVKDYIDECHKQGMRVGLYYSHEKDWYHHKKVHRDTASVSKEYKKIVETHLRELLNNYGQIDLIWFDMGIAEHKELNEMCYNLVREIQPDCIISSRIGSGFGDYKNLQDRELALPGLNDYVESIMTLRLNWGYDKNDRNWKSSDEVIAMLSKCACRNSNFLLNIGPQPDGRFTPEESVRLQKIGEWMNQHSEAIYNTKGSPFKGEYNWGSITSKNNKAYLHLYGQYGDYIEVNGIQSKVKKAYLLHSNKELLFRQNKTEAGLKIKIPNKINISTLPIIAVEFESELITDIQKGPKTLPPVIKHLTRTEINGNITAVNEVGFTINTGEKEYVFDFNENTEYRINKKGVISQTQGFYPQVGDKYKIIYSAHKTPKVEIITLIIN